MQQSSFWIFSVLPKALSITIRYSWAILHPLFNIWSQEWSKLRVSFNLKNADTCKSFCSYVHKFGDSPSRPLLVFSSFFWKLTWHKCYRTKFIIKEMFVSSFPLALFTWRAKETRKNWCFLFQLWTTRTFWLCEQLHLPRIVNWSTHKLKVHVLYAMEL